MTIAAARQEAPFVDVAPTVDPKPKAKASRDHLKPAASLTGNFVRQARDFSRTQHSHPTDLMQPEPMSAEPMSAEPMSAEPMSAEPVPATPVAAETPGKADIAAPGDPAQGALASARQTPAREPMRPFAENEVSVPAKPGRTRASVAEDMALFAACFFVVCAAYAVIFLN